MSKVTPRKIEVKFNFISLRHEARCPICDTMAYWISADAVSAHRQADPEFTIPQSVIHPCKTIYTGEKEIDAPGPVKE